MGLCEKIVISFPSHFTRCEKNLFPICNTKFLLLKQYNFQTSFDYKTVFFFFSDSVQHSIWKLKKKNGESIFSVAHVILEVILQVILVSSSRRFHFEVKFRGKSIG